MTEADDREPDSVSICLSSAARLSRPLMKVAGNLPRWDADFNTGKKIPVCSRLRSQNIMNCTERDRGAGMVVGVAWAGREDHFV